MTGLPLRSQPLKTLQRLAPTLQSHPGLPFHSLRPRWVINPPCWYLSLFGPFSLFSQGLDDEVPGFSFVNLFCFVNPSFSTSQFKWDVRFSFHILSQNPIFVAQFVLCVYRDSFRHPRSRPVNNNSQEMSSSFSAESDFSVSVELDHVFFVGCKSGFSNNCAMPEF